MRARSILLGCFTFMAISFSAGVAISLPRAAADASTEKARELHVQGDRLYARGQFDRALAAYLAAWSLKKHYQIAGNLGDCEVRLGKHRDAAEHLSYFIREYPKDKPTGILVAARRLFQTANSKIGTLDISVDADGADVLVDGKLVGQSPLGEPVYLEPGSRLIEAHHGQGVGWIRIEVTPGLARRVVLKPGQAMHAKRKHELIPVLAGAGLSVAAIGTGIGFLVKSESEPTVGGIRRTTTGVYASAGGASLVVGLTGAAMSAALLVFPPGPSRSARVGAVPLVSPRGAVFVMAGQF